jgi:hypothetical protein
MVKLTYDSIGKNSRIEFPRVIMPESLLALIFIVLLLPAFVKSINNLKGHLLKDRIDEYSKVVDT